MTRTTISCKHHYLLYMYGSIKSSIYMRTGTALLYLTRWPPESTCPSFPCSTGLLWFPGLGVLAVLFLTLRGFSTAPDEACSNGPGLGIAAGAPPDFLEAADCFLDLSSLGLLEAARRGGGGGCYSIWPRFGWQIVLDDKESSSMQSNQEVHR